MRVHKKIILGMEVQAYNDSGVSWVVCIKGHNQQVFDKKKFTMKHSMEFARDIVATHVLLALKKLEVQILHCTRTDTYEVRWQHEGEHLIVGRLVEGGIACRNDAHKIRDDFMVSHNATLGDNPGSDKFLAVCGGM